MAFPARPCLARALALSLLAQLPMQRAIPQQQTAPPGEAPEHTTGQVVPDLSQPTATICATIRGWVAASTARCPGPTSPRYRQTLSYVLDPISSTWAQAS